MKEAMFWEVEQGDKVRCKLCHHQCLIGAGKRGLCGVRENRDGRLVSLVYGRPVSLAVDPIEKKPLYHLLPGSYAFSTGTRGCNLRCRHCQNCEISQVGAGDVLDRERMVAPDRLVDMAVGRECRSIAYTYTEPTIFFEYAFDTAKVASAAGLKNIFVSNGYITGEALRAIAPYLDAANIDLKFFSDELYRTVCGARLQPVLDMIRLYHELGIWVELTTLIIPTYNDADADLRRIAEFIASVDAGIPWHVTGFYPTYKLTDADATPVSTLRKARAIGHEAGLRFVYVGNRPDEDGSRTRCPGCGEVLIERDRFRSLANRLVDDRCPDCGTAIPGVWA